jgi:hypothetical protein
VCTVAGCRRYQRECGACGENYLSALACADIPVRGSESEARSQIRIPIVREITEPAGEGQSTLFALP